MTDLAALIERLEHSRVPHFISLEEGRALLLGALPQRETEYVPPERAYGRTLAQSLSAKVSHPSATESALDGIACRAADTAQASAKRPVRLRVVGESRAGQPFGDQVAAGECVRIYTGAPLPVGADAICPIEQLTFASEEGMQEYAALSRPARVEDVRNIGDDFGEGDSLLAAGQRLTPARVALAVAGGYAALPVLRPPRVALLSTGDEVRPAGAKLAAGEVYDSNRYGLRGLLEEMGAEVLDLGHAPDSVDDLARRLDALAEGNPPDLLLTSGGVSMGRYDFMRDLVFERGEVLFWKLRLKPGGPTLLGRWNGLPVLGLPGNPVSSLVVFRLLVAPALSGFSALSDAEALMGRAPFTVRLPAGAAFASAGAKEAYWRAEVRGGAVFPYPKQSSGVLRSLSDVGALVRVPAGAAVEAGDLVEVLLGG